MGGVRGRLPAFDSLVNKFKVFGSSVVASNAKEFQTDAPKGSFVLQGWLHRKPKVMSKNLAFAHIRDPKGNVVQVVDKNTPSLFKKLKPDSVVAVKVAVNGDDIECDEMTVLSSSNLIPGELQAEKTKDWPAKYRYIQLRQPEFQKMLRMRAAIIKECRSVLEEEGFTEVETPLLFKSTPEGAREFLVPTRRKGYSYALPQSPQQYKQLLIASGIDKYYQLAKCFRDEDLRADRQPEFTQLDLEMGFAHKDDVQNVVEKIVKAAWKATGKPLITTGGLDARSQFSVMKYNDCIAKYGIDKPDLRSDVRLYQLDFAKAHRHKSFSVLEVIRVPTELRDSIQEYSAQQSNRVSFVNYENEAQLKEFIQTLASVDEQQWRAGIKGFLDRTGIQEGDLLAFGDRQPLSYENPTPLGRVRQQLAELDLKTDASKLEKSIAIWVEDFPSFEPIDLGLNNEGYPIYDYEQLKATHHPFTMVKLEDYHFLESDEPLRCQGMHFDLVIDGVEVGGGSQRIHDSDLQRYILASVLKIENPDLIFSHLLEALATGCPPHAGLAIGVDRMIAMLLGRSSIRDVIAFPKTSVGSDPVVGSPSKVASEQLATYNLRWK